MNKENKQKAKEERAQQRRKQEQQSQMRRALENWGPVVLIAVAVILLLALIISPGSREESPDESYDVTDGTEPQFDLVDENGNPLEVTDWTEIDEDEPEEEWDLDTAEGTVIADGDMVNISYEGRLDGELFEGGSAEDEDVEIGAGEYVDGFEEGIVGHAVGETFDMPVTFPDWYGDELGGKDVVFTVTINGIYRQ